MKTKLLISFFFALLANVSVNAQWYLQPQTGAVVSFSSIHCADSNHCFVAGPQIHVRNTVDGTNWSLTPGSVGTANKLFIKMYSKDTILLGQDNGTFKRTLNAGATWSADIVSVGVATSMDLYDVAFISNTNFTGVGGNPTNHVTGGRLTTSSVNTGQTWPNYTIGSGEPTFMGIHAINSNTFVACGGDASVYKSIDSGANWTRKLSGGPSTTTLYDINFPAPTIGYAVGGNSSTPATGGVVYKTINGGETWAATASAGLHPNALFGVYFVNADTGYVVGHGGYIQITLDGGASWTTQISSVTTSLNKIYFPTKKIGYIAGDNGVILKTINGGFIPPVIADAGSNKSICIGGCTTLGGSPTASGGTLPYTYSWNPGPGSGSSIVVCPTVPTTYTVTVTDLNGSTATDVVSVAINQLPVVSFSGLSANGYCNNASSVTLTGNPSGGTFTGVSGNTFNPVSAGIGTHTITYTYTDGNGCTNDSTQTVTVWPSPNPVSLCLVTVDSSMNNTENYVVWEKPPVANIDSFRIYRTIVLTPTPLATISYTANSSYTDNANGVSPKTQPHEYKITTIDTCGVESPLSASNTTMHLAAPVFTLPSSFALSWTDYSGFTFTNYEIWRTVDNGANWTQAGLVAYAAPTNTITLTGQNLSSRYRIRATAPAGCTNGATVFGYSLSNVTDDYTAVNEISLSSWLSVYPNPNQGTFSVELSGSGYEISGMKVFNMLGEALYQSSEKNKISEISIPGITPGVYHLEIITDKGTANKKITIQ